MILSLSIPWVIASVLTVQLALIHMGVDLGGADIRMTKEGLHRPQIRSSLEQMGGKGMTQRMNLSLHAGQCDGLLEAFPHPLSGKPPAAAINE